MTSPTCRVCGLPLLAGPADVLARGLEMAERLADSPGRDPALARIEALGSLQASAKIALLQLIGICWTGCLDQVVSAFAVLLGAQRLAREASCAR